MYNIINSLNNINRSMYIMIGCDKQPCIKQQNQ